MIEKVIEVFNLDVVDYKDVDESYSSTVKILTLEDQEKVALKIPYNKTKLMREYGVLEKLKYALPVPQVLGMWKGEGDIAGALLLSLLDGKPVKNVDSDLAYDLGELLAKLHRVVMDNYCLMDTPNNDWWQAVRDRFYAWIEECKPMLADDFLKACSDKFEALLADQDPVDHPVLVHFDFRPGNILVKDNKITGLIDFESSRGGAADIDFTKVKLYIWDKYPGTEEAFIKGYESQRPMPNVAKSLPLYLLFNGIGGLAWCIRRNKLNDPFYDENYNQVLGFLV